MMKLTLISCLIALLSHINGHQSSNLSPALSPFSSTSTAAATDIVADTCERAAAWEPEIDYNFCMSLLKSAPGSHGADLKGLAVISINLAKNNARRVLGHIHNLIGEETGNKYWKSCLEACMEVYADAVGDLKDSVKYIDSGRIIDARTTLSGALVAGVTCEEGFSEGNISSPLAMDDNYYQNITGIALTLAALLDN